MFKYPSFNQSFGDWNVSSNMVQLEFFRIILTKNIPNNTTGIIISVRTMETVNQTNNKGLSNPPTWALRLESNLSYSLDDTILTSKRSKSMV